jgi:diguanylate cyclase (GGDEF)-like protein
MFDWTAQFSQQRGDYVRRTNERLVVMDTLLSSIAQNPQNLGPLKDLSQHFHQLAGSSAIYEMEQLGENASQGEKVCLTVLRNGAIQKPEWNTLKDMVDAMRFACSRPTQNTVPMQQAQSAAQPMATASAQQQQIAGLPSARVVSQQAAQPQVVNHPAQTAEAPPANTIQTTGWSNNNQSNSGWDLQRSTGGWMGQASPFGTTTGYEKPKDVVIVDGDQTSMMTITRACEEAGMHVRGYRTTDGAKKAIQERLPDGLILSIPLIDGPGYDVAHHMRSLPDGNLPPVLILSHQIGFLDKVMAIRCGADAFFDELSEPNVIIKKLKSLFERDKPGHYTIMSVEDDPSQSEFIKGILDSVGYKVQVVNDPRQFEEAFLSIQPDLLLLDVMLGPVSGFELARYVRSDDRFAATPIIFLTTQNQLNAHVESARVGGDEHLIKPVAPQLLISAVAGRLERYRVLKKLIGRDGLTQFYTLGTFMESLDKLISKRFQGNGTMVLLLINIDHMEQINDRFGYAAGDRVIGTLAKMLRARLRNAEIFARLGGDEFAVVMDGIDDRELAEVATQIVQEFESQTHTANGQLFKVTISAGAAALDLDNNVKSWLNNAKLALKSAKTGGRNRVMKAKSKH